MKKLITLSVTIFALMMTTVAIHAQPYKKKKKFGIKPYVGMNSPGYYNGRYNRRGVYIYHSVRFVRKWRGLYRNTYKNKIFPNGRTKSKLISSVLIKPYRFYNGRGRLFYRTKIEYFGGKKYRVTYKIKRLRNGRVKKKIVHMQRIYWNNW